MINWWGRSFLSSPNQTLSRWESFLDSPTSLSSPHYSSYASYIKLPLGSGAEMVFLAYSCSCTSKYPEIHCTLWPEGLAELVELCLHLLNVVHLVPVSTRATLYSLTWGFGWACRTLSASPQCGSSCPRSAFHRCSSPPSAGLYTVKKRLAISPSRLGTGKSITFFYSVAFKQIT